MLLSEEYRLRNEISGAHVRYNNLKPNYLFLKNTNPKKGSNSRIWFLLSTEYKQAVNYHPGEYKVQLLQFRHNGGSLGATLRVIEDKQFHWDEYGHEISNFTRKVISQGANPILNSISNTCWEIFLYCHDGSFNGLSGILDDIHASLFAPYPDNDYAAMRVEQYLKLHIRPLHEYWMRFKRYSDPQHYAYWIGDLVVDV